MKTKSQKLSLSSYTRDFIKPVWCPGCGDYAVLAALKKSFLALEINPENIVCVSGIGCSGRFSHYLDVYSLHGTHGRAVPTAIGAKTARPDLTVVAVGGDGDGLGIGGGHIVHAARKNVDITYLLMDNSIYGLTKGQTSPTTPENFKTKTSPYGAYEDTIHPIPIFLSYDVSFLARTTAVDVKGLTNIVTKAIEHKGMSIVYILSPCMTFPLLQRDNLKEMVKPLPEDYTADNKMEALEYAYNEDHVYTGIFYQIQKPTLEDRLQVQIEKACRGEEVTGTMTSKEVLEGFA
jgi:2-oxoglutarate ferredoxin oxidoreductase subunit beta